MKKKDNKMISLLTGMTKKEVLFKNSYFFYYFIFVFASFVLSFIPQIDISPYILFFLLGFGWSIFFFRGKFSFIESLIISPIIFFSIFTSIVAILSLFSIQISVFIFYVFFIFSLVLFYEKGIFKKENFRWELEWYEILVIVMFLCALFVKVYPLIGMKVPNLSDSMTHAYYAKLIIETGEITFFLFSCSTHPFCLFNYAWWL